MCLSEAWASVEAYMFMARCETNIEIGNQSMNVICLVCNYFEVGCESCVCFGHGGNIELFHVALVCNDLFSVDYIHKGLNHCHIFDAGHVEPIHVLPDCNIRTETSELTYDIHLSYLGT